MHIIISDPLPIHNMVKGRFYTGITDLSQNMKITRYGKVQHTGG